MSILVGKRTFAENFSEMMISDFSRDNGCRAKMALNEHNLLNRGNFMQINKSQLLENAKLLKERFQDVDDNEILTVLDDCDNNMDIAIEILQKAYRPKVEAPAPAPVQITNRIIRKLPVSKNTQKNSVVTTAIRPAERNNQDIIPEEEMPVNNESERLLKYALEMVGDLSATQNLEQAKHIIFNALSQVKSEAEAKEQAVIKKLNEDKKILIKAHAKQWEKANSLERKNNDLNIMMSNYEQETSRLKQLNYKLELRIKTFDVSQNESLSYDVY